MARCGLAIRLLLLLLVIAWPAGWLWDLRYYSIKTSGDANDAEEQRLLAARGITFERIIIPGQAEVAETLASVERATAPQASSARGSE